MARSLSAVAGCLLLAVTGCSLDAEVEPSTAGVSGPVSSAATAAGSYAGSEVLSGAEFAALLTGGAAAYDRVHVEIAGRSGGVRTQVEGDLDASDAATPRAALTQVAPEPRLLVLVGGVLYSGSAGGPFGRGDPDDLPFALRDRLGRAVLGFVDLGAVTEATYVGDEDVGGVTAQHFETAGRGAMDGAAVFVARGRVVRFVSAPGKAPLTVTFSSFGQRVVIEPPEKGQDLLG